MLLRGVYPAAMLRALFCVARAIASAHDRWRASISCRRPLSAEVAVLHERVERLQAENGLLRARLSRIEPRRRPHYRPFERLQILWHRSRYGLSLEATARAFLVTVQALLDWAADTKARHPHLVKTRRPMNALPDLVGEIARRMKREWPRWGTRRIAGVLARLGLESSRTTVQRLLRSGPRRPAAALRAARFHRGPLVPKRPGHMYFLDFTKVGGLFRSVFVGAVIDGFSRRVLALRVCAHEPTAAFAVRLLREAVAAAGRPTWLVTDQGSQLTADEFTRALRRRGIRRRFGAIGKKGSIARMERLWSSLKQEFGRGLVLFRPLATIERRLRAWMAWHNEHRPHQGLGQRTPDEVHSGRGSRATSVPLRAVLEVQPLDDERELPVLRLRPAA